MNAAELLLVGGLGGAAASLALAWRWRHRLADRYTSPAVRAAVDIPLEGAIAVVLPKYDNAATEWRAQLDLELADEQFATCGWSFATCDVAGVPFDNGRIPTTCPGCGNYVDLIPARSGELHIVEHPVLWGQDADR